MYLKFQKLQDMYGVCLLTAIPMRCGASDKSEMTNQVLYGETFDILLQEEKWSKIRLHHDQYEGWIDNKQYQKTTKKVKNKYICNRRLIAAKQLILPLGAFVDFEVIPNKKTIIDTAKSLLNTPYLWGGRTCFGIDCSGFTQIIFRVHHISIPRDAYQQATTGNSIQFTEIQNGDLAFFANLDGRIIHVGILIHNKKNIQIIHASGKVRIDILDEKGIYNQETSSYTHQLHSIRRIIK